VVAVASIKVVLAFVEVCLLNVSSALIISGIHGSPVGCNGSAGCGVAVSGAAAVVADALGLGNAFGLALATRFKLTAAIVGVVDMAAVTVNAGSAGVDAAIEGKLRLQFSLEAGQVAVFSVGIIRARIRVASTLVVVKLITAPPIIGHSLGSQLAAKAKAGLSGRGGGGKEKDGGSNDLHRCGCTWG
jgi:hypothetical protein